MAGVRVRYGHKLFVLALALAATIAVELREIHIRKQAYWPLIQDTDAAQLTDSFIPIELRPSKRIMFHGAWFSTNRWAMRDQEYEMVPGADRYRIALLGPSYVMGSGVADDETFESLLEERLNRQQADVPSSKYEILNFGVAGDSALAELWRLESVALSRRPNAIFFVAQPWEDAKAVRHLADRARRGIELPYDYLSEIVREAGIRPGMALDEAVRRLEPYGSDLITWTYGRLVTLARQRGILPLWIYLPPLQPDAPEEVAHFLMGLASQAGFCVLDLSKVYANYDLETLVVAEWDRHPNARGHRLIADHLYMALQEIGLVPDDFLLGQSRDGRPGTRPAAQTNCPPQREPLPYAE